MQNAIEIPVNSIPALVRRAYDLSVPVGMGFIHAKSGSLTDEEVDKLIDLDDEDPVSMDYVFGRACKFHIMKEDDKFYMLNSWYDHSPEQLDELIALAKEYE